MKMLYIKIHAYEESSDSLIASFASDETASQNPDDYPSYAYQPLHMWPDVLDANEIKRRIAISGMYHANQQAMDEKFKADPVRVEKLKTLVGGLGSYSIEELTQNFDETDRVIEV